MIVTTLLLLSTVLLIFIYVRLSYQYFKVRRIPYLEPKFPFGSGDDLFLGKKSMIEFQCSIYEKLASDKIIGLFMFLKPTVYIANVDWIRDILVKDFACFCDRGLKFDTETEPLTRHLFHLEGSQWKYMRKKVMPMFTPKGISILLPRLMESGLKLRNYVGEMTTQIDDMDLKDIMSRYSADIIGKCAFGFDSLALTTSYTEFYGMSKRIFEPRIRTLMKLVLPKIPRCIVEYFDIKMISTDISKFFIEIMKAEMANRRRGQRQNDFMDFLLDLQKNVDIEELPVTDDLIMAHCFMFFIAGYENVTSVTSIALVELARNPDIQEKLYQEINHFCSTTTNLLNISYQELHSLVYLDMVVSEIIRLYPPATAVIRECTQDYVLPGSDIILNKGVQVVIPVCGLHRDPQYFPNPHIFNPENFNSEATAARNRYAYIPFGDGLRYCIGRKFGIMKVKIALLVLVSTYKFYPSPKMITPFQFEKKTFVTSLQGGAWVRVEKRKIQELR